ncbi:winged helix DNA-binding domain-containing protein [Bacteroidales bacterium OttesenSCG-928-B11]|nr:winged helix DNA-binding domain-containing protein [Bacteroidales bacterium OttesenSCG-928-E04]MDL2312842.1 winged helix DNA-binding domain-containing protein [Bacteroidales bacterium OttesenSCG-928-B11]
MTVTDLLHIRLHNQLLACHSKKSSKEIVSHLGIVQAQNFDMAKWAIGVRLNNATVCNIEDALNTGEILRTHILRPTWHFVAAEDIHEFRELSSARLLPIYEAYGKSWGADEKLIAQGSRRMEKLLEKHGHLTKQEIGEHLANDGFELDQHTLSHVLSRSELLGITCSGIVGVNKHTYALLEERVPKTKPFIKEEALGRLAFKFFNSHGPATIHDFSWWSGLLTSEAKSALELVKEHFVSETLNDKTFWMKNDVTIPEKDRESVLLLPPFDEFVVSYKDRSEIIEKEYHSKVMTKNGIFSSTIMLNGKIIGSWRKVKKKNDIHVELSFFEKTSQNREQKFEKEIERVKRFYDR